MKIDHLDLPYLAETLVMRELSKLGIYSTRLPPQFDFDLYCINDARIEVKSSRMKKVLGVFIIIESYILARGVKRGRKEGGGTEHVIFLSLLDLTMNTNLIFSLYQRKLLVRKWELPSNLVKLVLIGYIVEIGHK